MHIDLNEVDEAVLVQVEDKVVDESKPVANDDERKLVGKFGFLEEVFDLLRVVEVALSTNALNLTNLAGARGGLNVLEVYLGILAQVDNRAEVVIQPLRNVRTVDKSISL